MLSVVLTIWLLLQLPAALALGHFIACPQAMKRTEQRRPAAPPPQARIA